MTNQKREWKYDVRFCKCGRIHMIPTDKIHKAIEQDKTLMYICGGCGAARIIGADKESDWDDPTKTCYNMYSCGLYHKDHEIISFTPDDFSDAGEHKPYNEIIYSPGIRVPMMTGEYAQSYTCDTFCDMWYPDWWKIERKDVTVEEVMDFINKYKKDQRTVDMSRFIHETPEEYLDYISGYVIKAFDWKGTKWERK